MIYDIFLATSVTKMLDHNNMQLSIKVEKEGIMILKKILKLAEKNNISISCLEKTLGFGNGTIKKWRESSPSVDKLKKVADYFGVSIEYFLE